MVLDRMVGRRDARVGMAATERVCRLSVWRIGISGDAIRPCRALALATPAACAIDERTFATSLCRACILARGGVTSAITCLTLSLTARQRRGEHDARTAKLESVSGREPQPDCHHRSGMDMVAPHVSTSDIASVRHASTGSSGSGKSFMGWTYHARQFIA